MQDVHLRLFTGDIWTAWSAVNINRSGIYHSSHVVIRPILCITFKYTSILLFQREKINIWRRCGYPGASGAAGAVFRDTDRKLYILMEITYVLNQLHRNIH